MGCLIGVLKFLNSGWLKIYGLTNSNASSVYTNLCTVLTSDEKSILLNCLMYLSIFQYIHLTLNFQVFSISQYVYFFISHFLPTIYLSKFLLYLIKLRKVTIIWFIFDYGFDSNRVTTFFETSFSECVLLL